MTFDNLRPLLQKLRNNLNILQEREAKYAGEAPLSLLNQIEDHNTAIGLVKEAMIMDITLEELEKGLKSLILDLDRPTTPAKIQIPPPPEPARPPELGQFVGRQAELSYFSNKLISTHLAVISGMAGVGKTALAVNLAEIWQVWNISLPNRSTDKPRVEAVNTHQMLTAKDKVFWHAFYDGEGIMGLIWKLAGFLAHHGHDEVWNMLQTAQLTGGQPPPPDVLFDYVLKMIGEQGYLLCLDDIQWVEDDPMLAKFVTRLEPLIRAGEVSIIATSRHVPIYLHLDTSFESLTGLNAADVGRLVKTKGLTLPPEMVTELHTRTEGNAELLTLAINVLKKSNNPNQVMHHLSNTDDIERYLIKEIDDHLTEDDRDVLIAVAVLLGYPGSRDAIETVSQRCRLKRLILELSDRNLLTPETSDIEELYNEHAIVRAFYYDVPSRTERKNMHRLAAEYYEIDEPDLLKAALHYERAKEYEQAAGLATTNMWAFINQGQVWPLHRLLNRLVDQPVTPRTKISIHLANGQICAFTGQSELAKENFQVALNQLAGQPDLPNGCQLKAQACLGMGEALRYESPPEALNWLEQGLAELSKIEAANFSLDKAALQIRMGNVQWLMGDYDNAKQSLDNGLASLPQGANQWKAIALLNLGNVAADQGNFNLADEYGRQALEISEQLSDFYWMLVILTNQGINKVIAGNWIDAATDYQKALKLAQQLGNMSEQARIRNSIGMLAIKLGQYELALEHLSTALNLTRNHQLRQYLPQILASLATLKIRTKEADTALSLLAEAEQVALELEMRYPLAEIYYLAAQAQLAVNNLDEALKKAEQCVSLAIDLGLELEEGIGQRVLGQILLARNQPEPAINAFDQSLSLLANRNPFEFARTQTAKGRYLIAGSNIEQGLALLKEAQATFEQLGAQQDLAEVSRILKNARSASSIISQ